MMAPRAPTEPWNAGMNQLWPDPAGPVVGTPPAEADATGHVRQRSAAERTSGDRPWTLPSYSYRPTRLRAAKTERSQTAAGRGSRGGVNVEVMPSASLHAGSCSRAA